MAEIHRKVGVWETKEDYQFGQRTFAKWAKFWEEYEDERKE